MARKKTSSKKTATKRSSSKKTTRKASTAKRSRASSRAAAMPPAVTVAPAMPKQCGGAKWKGLGLFFLGALILLNGWRGWAHWYVFSGVVIGLCGLWYYFKYG